jgi:Na+/H+-translocating membrane pyrophosphatase
MRVFYATIVGLVVASVTEYYTGLGQNQLWHTKSSTGAGTNVIGLATGMISNVLLFAAAIWTSTL